MEVAHVVPVVCPLRIFLEHIEKRFQRSYLFGRLGVRQSTLNRRLRQDVFHGALVSRGCVHQDKLRFIFDQYLSGTRIGRNIVLTSLLGSCLVHHVIPTRGACRDKGLHLRLPGTAAGISASADASCGMPVTIIEINRRTFNGG